MKKIILVGNTSWSMIKFRLGLIKELINQKYNVIIIAPYDNHSEELKKLGCVYIDINIDNKGSNPLKDFKLILKLKDIYNEINPDLIIHYTIKPNIYGTISSKIAGFKSISVVTGLGYTFINDSIVSKVAKLLYKFSFKFSNKVLFINDDDKNEFVKSNLVKENKIISIPGEGVNTKFFNDNINIDNKDMKFILIARMLWDKGVGEYVEASNLLKQYYPNVEFGLLGYLDVDNPRAISKIQMTKWEEEANIKYYGSTDDVKKFISKSDCIILPSYREGISMILMESASMAKPLIATNVPGCKDLIDNGINGYLCQPKDSQDLANKIEMIINLNKENRDKMGQNGRIKMIENFDESIVINKYLNEIKNLIGDEFYVTK
jgi:glycosyltransferase involved in cell wall biosynthesis